MENKTRSAPPRSPWAWPLCRLKFVVVVTILCTCPFASRVSAQDPSTLFVYFDSRVGVYSLPASVEKQVSGRLAQACTSRLGIWIYRAAEESDYPRLVFGLKKGDNDRHFLLLSLVLEMNRAPAAMWQDELFPPGASLLRSELPQSSVATVVFGRIVEDRFLPNHLREILDTLEDAVPLGTEVAILPPQGNGAIPRAVLPIDWTKYCQDFGSADFVIFSKSDTNDRVILYSTGLQRSFSYKPDHPIFQGIGVQVNFRQDPGSPRVPIGLNGNQLNSLQPLFFHLKERRQFFQSCGMGATPPASVAPPS
jgi:hypothetical protein